MSGTTCSILGIVFECFQLDKNAPRLFGFPELISGLALTMLAWTVADIRYKFRIETAALDVTRLSIGAMFALGFMTLLTDYWRASGGWVPVGDVLSHEGWQFMLGLLFLLLLFNWLALALVAPPAFNPRNAARLTHHVEELLLRGSTSELAIVADELVRSAPNIVRHASENPDAQTFGNTERCANTLLFAIASPRFCNAVIEFAPQLIPAIFEAMSQQRKYRIFIGIFAQNILASAINHRNSFAYTEQDFHRHGLLALRRTITTAMFGDSHIVRAVDTLLDVSPSKSAPWEVEQWRAYCHCLIEAFESHLSGAKSDRPNTLRHAYRNLEMAYADLSRDLQLEHLSFRDDLYKRLETINELIKNMATLVERKKRAGDLQVLHVIDDVTGLIKRLFKAAASVQKPYRVATKIQRELLWENLLHASEFRNYIAEQSVYPNETGKYIQDNVHQWLRSSITSCKDLDSYRLLGLCLATLGFYPPEEGDEYGATWGEFHRWLICWTKQNIGRQLKHHSRMRNYCFVEGMTYEEQNNRLVLQLPPTEFGPSAPIYLDVNPPG
ncbi:MULTISPECIES: hypothetical protein [Pseudomonas]|uniref:hypothetical protein n=1 Tax=Pseudomonas TaxID=286 RepID=UPI002B40131E|nr:hypothetical protein [Pseudomonas sichuanensis]